MMKKIVLLTAAAAGYVLGARAGRERYEQIKSGAQKVAGDPRVQAATTKAQETVAAQATAVAGAAKEKVGMTGSGAGTTAGSPTTSTTTSTSTTTMATPSAGMPTTPDDEVFIQPAP